MLKLASIWVFWTIFVHTERSLGSEEFCYEDVKCGPDTWKGVCNTGSSQSPIDLPYKSLKRNSRKADLFLDDNYFKSQDFYLINSGHTVQAAITLDLTSTSVVTGTLLGGTYVFSQLHFHWGSHDQVGCEHTLDKRRFPLELHMVHYSSEFPGLNEAVQSKKKDAVTVFGIFFEISSEANEALTPIISQLSHVRKAKTNVTGHSLNLRSFMPPTTLKGEITILQYNGSLTTPTCDKVVLWNVIVQPARISLGQLQAFRRLKTFNGKPLVNNFRPIQKRNNRNVTVIRATVNLNSVDSLITNYENAATEVDQLISFNPI